MTPDEGWCYESALLRKCATHRGGGGVTGRPLTLPERAETLGCIAACSRFSTVDIGGEP